MVRRPACFLELTQSCGSMATSCVYCPHMSMWAYFCCYRCIEHARVIYLDDHVVFHECIRAAATLLLKCKGMDECLRRSCLRRRPDFASVCTLRACVLALSNGNSPKPLSSWSESKSASSTAPARWVGFVRQQVCSLGPFRKDRVNSFGRETWADLRLRGR